MRFVKLTFRSLFIFCLLIPILLSLMFAILQTKWTKETLTVKLSQAFKEEGVAVKIENLQGRLPFSWAIDEIEFRWNDGNVLTLKNVKMRLALIPLLRKTVAFTYSNIQEADFTFAFPQSPEVFISEEGKTKLREGLEHLHLPFHFVFNRMHIQKLQLHNTASSNNATFTVDANGKLSKDKALFRFNVKFEPAGVPQNYLAFQLQGNRAKNEIASSIKGYLDSLTPFRPLVSLPFDSHGDFDISLHGEWKSWIALFYDTPAPSQVQGSLKAHLKQLQIDSAPALDRPWNLDCLFLIKNLQALGIKKLILLSDILELSGKGDIFQDVEESEGDVELTLPNLSLLSDERLQGSLHAHFHYQNHMLSGEIASDLFEMEHLNFARLQAHVSALLEQQQWSGAMQLSAELEMLPFKSAWDFIWQPHELLSIQNFSVEGETLLASGDLRWHEHTMLFEGDLYAQFQHLSYFAPSLHYFIPQFDTIELTGNLGITCRLRAPNQEQQLRLHIVSENLLFQDNVVQTLTASAEFDDLYNEPTGRVHLLAEKLFTPRIAIDALTFSSSSDSEGIWPFFFHADGTMDSPLQCDLEGSFRKEPELMTLELTKLSGSLLDHPFLLKRPFVWEYADAFTALSPLEIEVGQGRLFATGLLSPQRSSGELELNHFPIDLFNLVHPRFALAGQASAKAFVSADTTHIQGTLQVALEEANITHFGKRIPLRTRGTMQAHLEDSHLQIHSLLNASDAQFLDLSASLPVDYTLYPFRLIPRQAAPLAAELIVEGKLEDLFDFVNLGFHSATGLLSTRLFLSSTLSTPCLQGHLDWLHGTYENYLTGTALSGINAQLIADGTTLKLIQSSASGDRGGDCSVTGSIALKPQEHFPYSFDAELHNLEALHNDMIDCALTGPMYFIGNTQSCTAMGNLLVSRSEITIRDELPVETPVLPVEVVHQTRALNSKTFELKRIFPFHIDVELTADDHVFVTGKGVNSEWEGSVHVTGTNMNIVASGELHLIKGEYDFIGKTFKLSEGQITFHDKPTPSAIISLSGSLALQDMVVSAYLRGPLKNPILTFQSNPQMSTSAILAYILFNKPISDISHPEALQLAQALMSLSNGAGPDVLTAIRKSLGVDRLTIVAAKPGSDQLAVQIGKYLTKGVMVTLSQSSTSSQVIVEVELAKGILFQAESQEEQEGKFSLKWTHSY